MDAHLFNDLQSNVIHWNTDVCFSAPLLFSCQGSSDIGSSGDTDSSTAITPEVARLAPSAACSVVVESIGTGVNMVSISPYEWMQQGTDAVAFVNEHQQIKVRCGSGRTVRCGSSNHRTDDSRSMVRYF